MTMTRDMGRMLAFIEARLDEQASSERGAGTCDPAWTRRQVKAGRDLLASYRAAAQRLTQEDMDAYDVGKVDGLQVAVLLLAGVFSEDPDFGCWES